MAQKTDTIKGFSSDFSEIGATSDVNTENISHENESVNNIKEHFPQDSVRVKNSKVQEAAGCDIKDRKKIEEGYSHTASWIETIIICVSRSIQCITRSFARLGSFLHFSANETNDSEKIAVGDIGIAEKAIDIDDIKTLEDALKYFHLFTLVKELDISLEHVRKCKKDKTEHKLFLEEVDKRIKKLSLGFHPDKARNRGDSDEEIKASHKEQAVINAIRNALKILNEEFLEYLETDHKYGFYTKIELSSLANENGVKSHICEVLLRIGLLSDIKQRKIIVEIQKFLVASQNCVQSYFDDKESEFEKHRDLSLYHLKCCIQGYEKLQHKLKLVENECEVEKVDNIISEVSKMVSENKERLINLQNLEKVAKEFLVRPFKFPFLRETLDEYFIQPFVYYVGIIIMCSVMIKNKDSRSVKNTLENNFHDLKIFECLHSLFSPFITNELSKRHLKEELDTYLAACFAYLKANFKECNYSYISKNVNLFGQLKECRKMMFDLKAKEKALSNDIESLTRKMKPKHEELKNVENELKEKEKINNMMKEKLEIYEKKNEMVKELLKKND